MKNTAAWRQAINPTVMTGWLERIEKLKSMNVLLDHEAETLKERVIKG